MTEVSLVERYVQINKYTSVIIIVNNVIQGTPLFSYLVVSALREGDGLFHARLRSWQSGTQYTVLEMRCA